MMSGSENAVLVFYVSDNKPRQVEWKSGDEDKARGRALERIGTVDAHCILRSAGPRHQGAGGGGADIKARLCRQRGQLRTQT